MKELCPRCGDKKHRGRCKKQTSATPPDGELVGATITASLEIPAGLGVRASIEGSTLQLEQDRPDDTDGQLYTHSLSLSPREARQLIEWLEQQIDKAA